MSFNPGSFRELVFGSNGKQTVLTAGVASSRRLPSPSFRNERLRRSRARRTERRSVSPDSNCRLSRSGKFEPGNQSLHLWSRKKQHPKNTSSRKPPEVTPTDRASHRALSAAVRLAPVSFTEVFRCDAAETNMSYVHRKVHWHVNGTVGCTGGFVEGTKKMRMTASGRNLPFTRHSID